MQTSPFQSIHLDHIVNMPLTTDGYKHILVIVDAFTHYTLLYPTRSTKASEVVEALQDLFAKFGGPCEIYSDNHGSFTAQDLKDICHVFNSRRRFSHAYVSTANGIVERTNQEVNRHLVALRLENYGQNWKHNLHLAAYVINTTPSLTTSFAPYTLMFGTQAAHDRQVRICAKDAELEPLRNPVTAANHVSELDRQLIELYERAEEHLEEVLARRLKAYADKDEEKAFVLEVGDTVLRKPTKYEKNLQGKYQPKYLGPYQVIKLTGASSVVIQDLASHQTHDVKVDQLRRFLPELYDPSRAPTTPTTPTTPTMESEVQFEELSSIGNIDP
jgi:transposase InsO family protein